ncbi:MAG: hypothetical protein OHK0029_33020 [Armatimonadaceae bacterium]
MPPVESKPVERARIDFADPKRPEWHGTLRLRDDRTAHIEVSPALESELHRFTEGVDTQTLKWGASLVVGLAALGAAFYVRRNIKFAWGFFLLSGLSGLVARKTRAETRRWQSRLLSPLPVAEIGLSRQGDIWQLDLLPPNGPPLRGVLRIETDNLPDPAQALHFQRELATMQSAQEKR